MPSQFPHFIQEHLIHFDVLHLSRKSRSALAFLRNLQFYEVCNKQVLNFIDLQNTILTKVQNKLESIVPEVNEVQSQASDILGSSIVCPSYTVGGIMLGKYIYQNRENKKVYIVLKCWDVVVIIKRDEGGFTLQAEYKNVRAFKMCKSNNYQVQLAISFLYNEQDLVTNFQEHNFPSSVIPNANAFRKTLNKIKMKQSELLVHKTITKKEFAMLKSTDVFGCNLLRTPRLEEMQILSKCGDAWVKATADDDIVIGVPLINNCSSRMTILRNPLGVLQCHGSGDLHYKCTLYQLNKKLGDIENIQSFFQMQGNHTPANYNWSQCTELTLRPEAFCVIVLRIKMNEIYEFSAMQFPLFVFYDIVESKRTFSQKCFITMLSFRDVFTNESCRLNFNEKHLHRDFLTVIATSFEAEALLQFNANSAAFEDYLCSKMHFFRVSCKQSCSATMNVDGQDEDNDCKPETAFFYNKNSDSVWHGTLLAITYAFDSYSNATLYTKTQEKSNVFFKLLYQELMVKCGIENIRRDTRNLSVKLIELEAALRDECNSYLEMCSCSAIKNNRIDISKKQYLQNNLHLSELKTDTLLKDLEL